MFDPNLLCMPWFGWPVSNTAFCQQKQTRYWFKCSAAAAQQRWLQLKL